jgi:molecular chaperone DnaK (HSP70)
MEGGSSQIPSVQRSLPRMFGRDKVKLNRPLDAVARGAAVFVAGMGFYDYIQHDYAIRFGVKGKKYKYHTIVEHGTAYPTSKALARLSVKAGYEGQSQLGLAIFEISSERPKRVSQAIELIFDPSGAARMVQLTPEQEERRHQFWMNEGNPTFLTANPPAEAGKKRFEVEFSIDGNKRLLITVRDLKTGRLTHQNYPVVKLT